MVENMKYILIPVYHDIEHSSELMNTEHESHFDLTKHHKTPPHPFWA